MRSDAISAVQARDLADVLERELSRFLRDAAARRFRLGEHDCGLWLADWVIVRRGLDPAASVRGRYHDRASLDELLSIGGLPRLFDRLFREAGLMRTIVPICGDVAMISIAQSPPTGALRTARGFAVLADGSGVHSVPVDRVRLVAAWKV